MLPENKKYPLVFWGFQGVKNGNIGQKWVNPVNLLFLPFILVQHLLYLEGLGGDDVLDKKTKKKKMKPSEYKLMERVSKKVIRDMQK